MERGATPSDDGCEQQCRMGNRTVALCDYMSVSDIFRPSPRLAQSLPVLQRPVGGLHSNATAMYILGMHS